MGYAILEAALGLPAGLLGALCAVESGQVAHAYNPRDGKSASHGECQLKARTAQGIWPNVPVFLLYVPKTNRKIAGCYLASHAIRYGNWRDAVASYNAGRVKLTATGAYINTRYVEKVHTKWLQYASKEKSLRRSRKSPLDSGKITQEDLMSLRLSFSKHCTSF